MSGLKFPRIEMYWRKSLKVMMFSETMTHNRFYQLRSNLHIVNNLEMKDSDDKFFKVRPIFEFVRKRCKELEMEQDLSVDEQIIPFKGHHSTKQYMKKT